MQLNYARTLEHAWHIDDAEAHYLMATSQPDIAPQAWSLLRALQTEYGRWGTERQAYGIPLGEAARGLAQRAQEQIVRGCLVGKRSDFALAADLYQEALLLAPGCDAIRKRLGWLYIQKLKRPVPACHLLARVVAAHPVDHASRNLYLVALSDAGQEAAATRVLDDCAALDPLNPHIRARLARREAIHRLLGKAATSYQAILRDHPGFRPARLGLIEIDAWQGSTSGPIRDCRLLIAEDREELDARILLADLYRWDWRIRDAESEYREALTRSPDNPAALDGLRRIEELRLFRLSSNYYLFGDSDHFLRQGVEGTFRIPLWDGGSLTSRAGWWNFEQRDEIRIARLDGSAELEQHWIRGLSTTAQVLAYTYNDRNADVSASCLFKWSVLPLRDLYLSGSYAVPVTWSIKTVMDALSADIYGGGFDAVVVEPVSVQGSWLEHRYSDGNLRHEGKVQISWKPFPNVDIALRSSYDFLGFADASFDYFSPNAFQVVGPGCAASYPLLGWLSPYGTADLRYVIDHDTVGYEFHAGFKARSRWKIELQAEYFTTSLPNVHPFAGQGCTVSASISF